MRGPARAHEGLGPWRGIKALRFVTSSRCTPSTPTRPSLHQPLHGLSPNSRRTGAFHISRLSGIAEALKASYLLGNSNRRRATMTASRLSQVREPNSKECVGACKVALWRVTGSAASRLRLAVLSITPAVDLSTASRRRPRCPAPPACLPSQAKWTYDPEGDGFNDKVGRILNTGDLTKVSTAPLRSCARCARNVPTLPPACAPEPRHSWACQQLPDAPPPAVPTPNRRAACCGTPCSRG